MNNKLSGALEKIMPSKEVMDRVDRELAIEEKTGKCGKCKRDSHFGKCEDWKG